jgi:uncharacterized membrane protein
VTVTGVRSKVLAWAEAGAVPADRVQDALRLLGVLPTAAAWRGFLDRLSLWLGVTALGAAVIFFVAANWAAIGRWAKFGLVEAVVVAGVLAYAWLGTERTSGKAALLGASLALGALLALVGQTYQTGADTFELFASWAALILPWAMVGRFAGLWALWLAIANAGIVTWFSAMGGFFEGRFSNEQPLWALAALDTGALVAWEIAARRLDWLRERWAPRLLALASGSMVTMLMTMAITRWRYSSGAIAVVYPLWLAAGYAAYRRQLPDLFMLAGGCLSVIVCATAFLGRHVLDDKMAASFLMIGIAVVVMAGAAAVWLRAVGREQSA